MYPTIREVHRAAWRGGVIKDGIRFVPEEVPIAITYNGGSQAVMMGTPQDLEDFAIGFSLNDGLIENLAEIEDLKITWMTGSKLRMYSWRQRPDWLRDGDWLARPDAAFAG